MKLPIRLITTLTISAAIVGCSSPKTIYDDPIPPAEAPHTEETEEFSQVEYNHNLSGLHDHIQEIILAWYEAEDHGGEIRTLAVIDTSPIDPNEETDLFNLELLERRTDPRDPEKYCYEGVVYLNIQDSQVQSVGRYGHDCCPGVECEMGPENWMGRLFDLSRNLTRSSPDEDFEALRRLIHPDKGVLLKAEWSDRDDEDLSGSAEWNLSASDFPGERGVEFLSCGPNFMAGFSFACQDHEEGFRCSCRVPGIDTLWTWQWIDDEAYLVEIWQSYHE